MTQVEKLSTTVFIFLAMWNQQSATIMPRTSAIKTARTCPNVICCALQAHGAPPGFLLHCLCTTCFAWKCPHTMQ